MKKLNEKKRKGIIGQFRIGRSATELAKTQKISRQMVYNLINRYTICFFRNDNTKEILEILT
jgi:Mor family transcriptional regulator